MSQNPCSTSNNGTENEKPILHCTGKPKVWFLCVHNSCRSQIAEALGKKLAGDVFESYSAGTQRKGRVAEMKSAARPFMRRPKEYVADRLWKNKRLGKEKGMAKQTLG